MHVSISALLIVSACGRIGFDPIDDALVRRQVTIDHTAITETLADFPVSVALDATFDYARALPDGSDLRFVDGTGTPLDREIETWNPGGRSALWVRVPSMPPGERTAITLEYGDGVIQAVEPTRVWSNGFRAVWHLSDPAACPTTHPSCIGAADEPVLHDSTVFANHGHPRDDGTGVGALEPDDNVEGVIGGGLQLGDDPADPTTSPDLILVPDNDSLDLPGASLTISAWVALEIDNVEIIVLKPIAAYPVYQPRYAEWGLAWNLGGDPDGQRLCWFANAGGVLGVCPARGSMPLVAAPAAWHHIALTVSGTGPARAVRWFVDGILVETTPSTQPDISDTTGFPVIIGGASTNDDELVRGRLDELEIANVPRSAPWILASYLDATGAVTVGAP